VQSRFTEIAVNSDCDQGTKLGELYPVINFIHRDSASNVWIVAKGLESFQSLSINCIHRTIQIFLYTKSATVKLHLLVNLIALMITDEVLSMKPL